MSVHCQRLFIAINLFTSQPKSHGLIALNAHRADFASAHTIIYKGVIKMFIIVEKKNKLAVHAHCHSKERAQNWLDVNAPEYCLKGYFMDKTLTPNSFEIVERA